MSQAPKARLETWNRQVLQDNYDALYALCVALQRQPNTSNDGNMALQVKIIEYQKALHECSHKRDELLDEKLQLEAKVLKLQEGLDGRSLDRDRLLAEKLQKDNSNQKTSNNKQPNQGSMEASPQDIEEFFAQIERRDEQLRMQADRIREMEELVTQQSDKLAQYNAPSSRSRETPDECKKKCKEMEERLCRLFKAIKFPGEAVKAVAREETAGLKCGDGCQEDVAQDGGRKGLAEDGDQEDEDVEDGDREEIAEDGDQEEEVAEDGDREEEVAEDGDWEKVE